MCIITTVYHPRRVQKRYSDESGVYCSTSIPMLYKLEDKIQFMLSCQLPWPCKLNRKDPDITLCDMDFLQKCPYDWKLDTKHQRCSDTKNKSLFKSIDYCQYYNTSYMKYFDEEKLQFYGTKTSNIENILIGHATDPVNYDFHKAILYHDILRRHHFVNKCKVIWPCKTYF